jgi:putative MATE family efflux protein
MSTDVDPESVDAEEAKSIGPGAGKRAAFARDWTQGSITRNLLTLAWPVVISNSLNMLGPTIDMIWVGKLGASAMAAVGLSGQIVTVVNSLMMGLFTSLRAMVARRVGAGDEAGANRAVQQAFVIGVAFSTFMAVIGILLSHQILNLFGAEEEVVHQALLYNQIQFVGMITMTVRMLTEATMQSSGDTVTAMRIGVFFRLLHIGLCPFLVFGWWIFPNMGVAGAATMNVISQGIGASLGMWFLLSGHTRLRISFTGFRVDASNIWQQLKIGVPSSINSVLRSFVGLFIIKFIVPYGTVAVAAHSLGQRIETFLDVGASAFGNAAGVLAGQNLGAHKPERAQRTGWIAVGFATAVMFVIGMVMLIFPGVVVRIFNSDPKLVKIASTFLQIAVVSFLAMGPASVLTSCLNGVGDTMIPLLASFATMWAVQLPLAAYLPKVGNLGVYGVRWSMAIALSLRAITYLIYFKIGRWKRRSF